ncbi:MAG: Gfo/Idh/MocA family oxidoreductase [Sedimentisphaeraceae bacterium JB056]
MLKIGIIGLSEGNGHPYSWSAIINGDYDRALMADCGYPVIPAYLGANRDTLGIEDVRVTHIWTQDKALSKKVADAAMIDNVADEMTDMIGQVDAVLLARDDPENHRQMSEAFIDAGVPLFIDKPLAFSRNDLDYFTKKVDEGKFIMSCSAMRYSAGVQSQRDQLSGIGEPKLAVAVGAKDLRKYTVHYLEGMLAFLNDPKVKTVQHMSESGKDIIYLELDNGMLATVHTFMGLAGGELNIYGDKGVVNVNHGGAYVCFRAQLIEAVRSFREGKPRLDYTKTYNVINSIVAARESLQQGGKKITL